MKKKKLNKKHAKSKKGLNPDYKHLLADNEGCTRHKYLGMYL